MLQLASVARSSFPNVPDAAAAAAADAGSAIGSRETGTRRRGELIRPAVTLCKTSPHGGRLYWRPGFAKYHGRSRDVPVNSDEDDIKYAADAERTVLIEQASRKPTS